MKKNLLIIVSIISLSVIAQVPQGVGYQAVATDDSGVELINQNISIRASILSTSATGNIEWEEIHATTTDTFGLFSITIGQGNSTGNGAQANFADISWGTNTHFLKIEMDVTGGSNYSFMGTNQMMSVPYALYAESAGNLNSNSNSGNSNNSGGNFSNPIELSNESSNAMPFSNAMIYCDSLVEGGNSDWVLPSIQDVVFLSSGGGNVPDPRTSNYLWTHTIISGQQGNWDLSSQWLPITLEPGGTGISSSHGLSAFSTHRYVRCVRYGSISVSSSGSNGSSTAATLGNGMPTMISNESTNSISFSDAILYCDSLSESGYDDWVMPNFDQLSYAISGGCIIPDVRTEEFIWSRSYLEYSGGGYVKMIKLLNTNHISIDKKSTGYNDYSKCRCVR